MKNTNTQRGRPKGEKPAMTPAERMARTRKRRAIYKEECQKVGIVPAKPHSFDKALLSVFESAAEDMPDTCVEDLLFLAMRDFAVRCCESPELSKIWKKHVEAAGIDDLSNQLAMFNVAKIQTLVRLSDEGLLEISFGDGL